MIIKIPRTIKFKIPEYKLDTPLKRNSLLLLTLILSTLLPYNIVFCAETVTEDFTTSSGTGWDYRGLSHYFNSSGFWINGNAIKNTTIIPSNTTYDIVAYYTSGTKNAEYMGLCDAFDTATNGDLCLNGMIMMFDDGSSQYAFSKCIGGTCTNVGSEVWTGTEDAKYFRIVTNATGWTGYYSTNINTGWTLLGSGTDEGTVPRTGLYPVLGQADGGNSLWGNITLWYYNNNELYKNGDVLIYDNSTSHFSLFNTTQHLNFTAEAYDDLTIWYRMDEGTGTSLYSSGSDNAIGTINNAHWNTTNKYGSNSLYFDADGDYVTFNPNLVDDSQFTLSTWVKPSAVDDYAIVWSNADAELGLSVRGDNKYGFYVGGQDIWGTSAINLNDWTNVVGTFNGTGFTLYVNGVRESSKAIIAYADITAMSIGRRDAAGGIWYYKGLIDDVKVFNKALTESEILDLYNNNLARVPVTQMLNITIPSIPITMVNYTSGSDFVVTFNNTNVYNYTVIVQNFYNTSTSLTKYFYTNPYYLQNIELNKVVLNNSNQQVNISLNKYLTNTEMTRTLILENPLGTNTTLTEIGTTLNYTHTYTAMTNEIIENLPIKAYLLTSYIGETLTSSINTTQTVGILEFDDCSIFTNELINLTTINESDSYRMINILNSSLRTSFNISNNLYALTQTEDANGVFGICINNSINFTANVDFTFYGEGWGSTVKREREHFFFNTPFNTTTIYQKTFMLNETTAEKIIFNLINEVQQPLKNYYLVLKRWYGDGYETVAMAKTDVNGQAITYVEYNDPYYAFDVLDNIGRLVYSTDRLILTTTPTNIQISTSATNPYSLRKDKIDYINTWDNSTEYFTTIMSHSEGKDTIFQLLVYSLNNSLICNKISSQTTSWTGNCYIYNWMNNSFIVIGRALTTDSGTGITSIITVFNYLVDSSILISASIYTPKESVIFLFIIMLIITMAFLGFMPNFIPLSPCLSLLISNLLGITSFNIILIGGLGISGIIFIFWFMRS